MEMKNCSRTEADAIVTAMIATRCNAIITLLADVETTDEIYEIKSKIDDLELYTVDIELSTVQEERVKMESSDGIAGE
jgi:hypothetical protein